MNRFIDIRQACMTGITIKANQVVYFSDHRKTLELRKEEQEHFDKCETCNPTLLAEQWFGKPVVIVTEAHYVGKK